MGRSCFKSLYVIVGPNPSPQYVGEGTEANAASFIPGMKVVTYEDDNHNYKGWVERQDFERYIRTLEWYVITSLNKGMGNKPIEEPDNIMPEVIRFFVTDETENCYSLSIPGMLNFADRARDILKEHPYADMFWVEASS
jgi:hypothetical protein